ncbi:MAG: DUF1801 domain-containing protein [Candidatus Marinimicrobia bacterium]|nr:DUF1801 domain-containing protein [Candidatus Neomarinimicrobiota bacterium]
MVKSKATTVEEYISELPSDRTSDIKAVRQVILDNLPKGYVETMQYGMITYVVPFERYPNTYNGLPLGYISLASQKNYMALYLMNVYGNKEIESNFKNRYIASGKNLDMGKSCVRFKKLEDLPIDLIGETVAITTVEDFIKKYEESRK